MIQVIDFISKKVFESAEITADTAVISIVDIAAASRPHIPPEIQSLQVELMDMTPEELESHGLDSDVLARPEDIARIISFIHQVHADPSVKKLLVHCNQGLSRSAAVALVACQISKGSLPRFHATGMANTWLLDLASKELTVSIPKAAFNGDPASIDLSQPLLI